MSPMWRGWPTPISLAIGPHSPQHFSPFHQTMQTYTEIPLLVVREAGKVVMDSWWFGRKGRLWARWLAAEVVRHRAPRNTPPQAV